MGWETLAEREAAAVAVLDAMYARGCPCGRTLEWHRARRREADPWMGRRPQERPQQRGQPDGQMPGTEGP